MNMSVEFESKKKAVKDWLDRVVKSKIALIQLGKSEYNDFGAKLCGEYDAVHMFAGLETIAFYLGQTVVYDPMWCEDRGRMYFMYKGLEVFQLWNKQL